MARIISGHGAELWAFILFICSLFLPQEIAVVPGVLALVLFIGSLFLKFGD